MKIIATLAKIMQSERSIKISMIVTMALQPIGMILSFVYTPLLLDYLGYNLYGLWSTIMSTVSWFTYLDIGVGNGLRNHLVKDIVANNDRSIKESVSTAYYYLSRIMISAFAVLLIITVTVNVGAVFNSTYNESLKIAVIICFADVCLNLVLSLSKSEIYAMQKAEVVTIVQISVQVLKIIGIFLVSLFSSQNIIIVAMLAFITTTLSNVACMIYAARKNPAFSPKFCLKNKKLFSEICNVGLKFFIIQICALILFSSDKIIITHLFGAGDVTPYDLSQKAFSVINGMFAAFIAPLWSKFTMESQKGNYNWIRNVIRKLSIMCLPICVIYAIMFLNYDWISRIWLRKDIIYPSGLTLCMCIFYILSLYGGIFTSFLNGTGQIRASIIVSVLTSAFNIPLSIYLARDLEMGTPGIILATVICTAINNGVAAVKTMQILHTHKLKGE